jgi:homoserine O-succinyltransferase/O-acetyltransferase
MTIAILDMYDNRANEGMRCIRQLIRQTEAETGVPLPTTVFNVRADHALPGLDFDIYISTGGPGVPLPVGEPWEKPFFALMDALFDHNDAGPRPARPDKKHVFLICHSFQLVIDHWQLAQVSRRKSTSFGVLPVHRTDEGCSDPLFGALPNPFFAVDSRDFQVTQPNPDRIDALGASILALEKIRPHVGLERAVMAMRFSPEIVGTQFHPEADAEGMLRYFEMAEKKQAVIDNYGEAKYDEMLASLRDPDKIELTESVVLPGFLRQAIFYSDSVQSSRVLY